MQGDFTNGDEGGSSILFSARIELAALLRLLLKKKVIQSEEFLAELNAISSDEYVYSIRRFVAQSEKNLRNGRWHIGGANATEQLGRWLLLSPGDCVLDIGCGIGGPDRQIAEMFGSTVIGVDYRIERVIEATLRTTALGMQSLVRFQVADGEHLPFEDGAFDAVLSQAALHQIPDKVGVVREALRVLRPGGRFGFECEALTEKASLYSEEDQGRLFRILAWQQLLGATGFEQIEIEEMWEESRQFYPTGPEREQIDRGERVNVRLIARKP